MPFRGFEPVILARERPQNHALDRAGTGIDYPNIYLIEVMTSQFCSHVSTKETKP
jgi:hypothetical protein